MSNARNLVHNRLVFAEYLALHPEEADAVESFCQQRLEEDPEMEAAAAEAVARLASIESRTILDYKDYRAKQKSGSPR